MLEDKRINVRFADVAVEQLTVTGASTPSRVVYDGLPEGVRLWSAFVEPDGRTLVVTFLLPDGMQATEHETAIRYRSAPDLNVANGDRVFKIQRKDTGLFSRGGSDSLWWHRAWTRTGKIWSSLRNLRNHLTMVDDAISQGDGIDQWEVVEFALVEVSRRPARECRKR